MSVDSDPFDWSGGHPALDLVNTLDERPSASPIETLATYRDLLRFTESAGLVAPSLALRLRRLEGRAGARIVASARRLCEHLHDLLAGAHAGRRARPRDIAAISAAIRSAHAARALVASTSPRLAAHAWSPPLAAGIPLHACALAIEHLLLKVDPAGIRKCGAADCDVFYVDTSKGRRRTWCSMRGCGNREKQRRWRSVGARHKRT